MASAADLFIRVQASVDQAIGQMKELQSRISGAIGGSLDEATSKGQQFTSALDKAQPAGIALAGIGAGIAGGLGLAVNAAADFEAGLSGIKAVSGATETQMDAVREAALRLGADTRFSAGEAAAGFEELIKGGLSIEDALAAAKPMLDLAAAGEIAVADAAEIAANAIGIFSLKGEDMTNVANQIAGAANASSLSVSDFQFSMAAAGSVAAGVGQSFDDLAVAIAIMGKNGLKGSDAGTSLKTMLMNLQPSTKDQIATFRQLGILELDTAKATEKLGLAQSATLNEIENATGAWAEQLLMMEGVEKGTASYAKKYDKLIESFGINNSVNLFLNDDGTFKDMASIAGILQDKLGGLTDAQRAQALETMFGSDAIRAANIFFKEGATGFADMAAAMGNVTAADVGAEKMNNLKGVLDALRGSMETVAIQAGTVLLPPLRSLAEMVTGLVNRFMELSPGMQQTIVIGAAVAGVFSLLLGSLLVMAPFLAALPAAFAAIGTIAGIVGGVIGGPVVLAIGALVAAGALLYAAWQGNWGGIQQIVAGVWAWLQGVFTQVVAWLQVNIPAALATLSGFWTGTLLPAITAVWSFIQTYLIPLFSALGNVAFAILGKQIEVMVGLWQNVLLPALRAVWSFLQAYVGPALLWVANVAIAGLIDAVQNRLGPPLQWFAMNVLPALSMSLRIIGTLFGPIVSGLNLMAGAISRLQLPAWLTPGSPTPLETGLWGVLSAVRSLSGASMPAWMAGGTGTLPAASFAGTTGGGAAAAANMGVTVNVTQNPDGTWSATATDQYGVGNLRLALNEVART